jgi:hypothetical protein
MTLDKLVTQDLRALAMANRQVLVPLERSIAAVAPREVVDTRLANRVLVVASRIYCQRAARATAAATALVCFIAGVFALDPFDARDPLPGASAVSFLLQPACVTLALGIVVTTAYLCGLRLSGLIFEWHVRRAIERGISSEHRESGLDLARRLLRRPERTGIILEIAAITAAIVIATIIAFTLGKESLAVLAFTDLFNWDGRSTEICAIWNIALAIGLATSVAIVIGVMADRPALLRRVMAPHVTAMAIGCVVVALCIGFAYDRGSLGVIHLWQGEFVWSEPDSEILRAILITTGVLSVGVLVGQLVLWRRHRELAMIDGDARPIEDGDRVIVGMASLYERRIARVAFGAICFAAMVAVLLGYQQWDGAWNPNYGFLESLRRQDPIVITAMVALFAVVIQVVTRSIARRRFEDRVKDAPAMIEAGRRLVSLADPWAIRIGLGGITAAMVMFGVSVFSAGIRPWIGEDRWRWDPHDALAGSIVGFVVVALAAHRIARKLPGRRSVRVPILERPLTPIFGIAAGFTLLVAGMFYDALTNFDMIHGSEHHVWMIWPDWSLGMLWRLGVTIAGSLSLVVVLFGGTIARRRRDLDSLGI